MKLKDDLLAGWPEGLPRSWACGPFDDAGQALGAAEALYAARGLDVERGSDSTPAPDTDEVELMQIGSRWWLHQRPRVRFRAPPQPDGVSLTCVDGRVSEWRSVEGRVLLAAADPTDPATSFARALRSTLDARVALVLRPRRWTGEAALDEVAHRIAMSAHRRVVLPRGAGVLVGIDGADVVVDRAAWSRLADAGFDPGPARLPARYVHAWAFVRVERPEEVSLDAVTLALGSGADGAGHGTLASLASIGDEHVLSGALADPTRERTLGLSVFVAEDAGADTVRVSHTTIAGMEVRVTHRVPPPRRWKVEVQSTSTAMEGGVVIEALARVLPTTDEERQREGGEPAEQGGARAQRAPKPE